MDPVSNPFNKSPIPGSINHTKIKVSFQEMAKENFIPREEEVNWNHNPHVTSPSSISLKPKTPEILNLIVYKKVLPFVKNLFKETRDTFPMAGRLIFLKRTGKKLQTIQQS